MDKQTLKHLRDLSRRATDSHVIGHGSANIVIHASEFYALEEAIELLSTPTDLDDAIKGRFDAH